MTTPVAVPLYPGSMAVTRFPSHSGHSFHLSFFPVDGAIAHLLATMSSTPIASPIPAPSVPHGVGNVASHSVAPSRSTTTAPNSNNNVAIGSYGVRSRPPLIFAVLRIIRISSRPRNSHLISRASRSGQIRAGADAQGRCDHGRDDAGAGTRARVILSVTLRT
jgi:hypothetical protein